MDKKWVFVTSISRHNPSPQFWRFGVLTCAVLWLYLDGSSMSAENHESAIDSRTAVELIKQCQPIGKIIHQIGPDSEKLARTMISSPEEQWLGNTLNFLAFSPTRPARRDAPFPASPASAAMRFRKLRLRSAGTDGHGGCRHSAAQSATRRMNERATALRRCGAAS
jgi:hypothetical protein